MELHKLCHFQYEVSIEVIASAFVNKRSIRSETVVRGLCQWKN